MKRALFSLAATALVAGCLCGADPGPVSGKAWTIPLPDSRRLAMVWLAPGEFTMGSAESEPGHKADEKPFQATLTHGYWMGVTEVTVAQWRAVMGTGLREHLKKVIDDDTLYDFDGKQRTIRAFMNMTPDGDIGRYLGNEDDGLPMYFTSWNDAMEYCGRLTSQERDAGRLPVGYEYSLPTEAQWEYGARAGNSEMPPSGAYAWYNANSKEGYEGKSVGRSMAGPRLAGVKEPNAWGLRDMAGNLWEWCADWYGPYPAGSVSDPRGPSVGVFHVNKGGSWGSGAGAFRPANRATNPAAEASAYRGFRVVLAFAK